MCAPLPCTPVVQFSRALVMFPHVVFSCCAHCMCTHAANPYCAFCYAPLRCIHAVRICRAPLKRRPHWARPSCYVLLMCPPFVHGCHALLLFPLCPPSMGTPDMPTMTKLCYVVTTYIHTTNVQQPVTVRPHNRAAQVWGSQHECAHGTATRGACSRHTD
jgi:hypothetical protein